jgi:large subunit ribosomal protein L28
VVRKGLAKKKGGTGSKIVRSTKRKFLPNLQKMRILIANHVRKVYICAKCIKKGDFKKA